jgi:Cu2+-exporting ATPase
VIIQPAAGVLYNVGFMPSPAVGGVFMSLSTIIVAINAQLLRKKIGHKQNLLTRSTNHFQPI